MTKKSINGIISDMTAEEQTQFEQDQTRVSEVIANEKAEFDNLKNLKASAKAKLVAGEPLTDEEAATIVP
tara:strand:+ start:485 stop:694 length:210 start_codon:yes stop_codon:yes gene_type:complete